MGKGAVESGSQDSRAKRGSPSGQVRVCRRCGSEDISEENAKAGKVECGNCGFRAEPVMVTPAEQGLISTGYAKKLSGVEKRLAEEGLRRAVERIIALLVLLALMFFLSVAALITVFGY